MEQIISELQNLQLQMTTLKQPLVELSTKIESFEKLLKEEANKLHYEQKKISTEETRLKDELIQLGWIETLLENEVEDYVLLNDKCLGNKRKFFETLRIMTDLNNDPIKITTGIGKYLEILRKKYTIEKCIITLEYEKEIITLECEKEIKNVPSLKLINYKISKDNIELFSTTDLIDSNEIIQFYSNDKSSILSSLDDSNNLEYILNCWLFKIKT
jgi:hypothetical protein